MRQSAAVHKYGNKLGTRKNTDARRRTRLRGVYVSELVPAANVKREMKAE